MQSTFDSLKRTFIEDKRLLVDLRIIRSSTRNNMIDYDKVLKIFRKNIAHKKKINKYENLGNYDFALLIMRLRV